MKTKGFVMTEYKGNHKGNHKVGRLIIVDDEAELMTALSEMLARQGYETVGFTTGAEALNMMREQDYDLLLTDMMMPEMDGIELLRAALVIDPDVVGIVMTGQGTVQTAVEAMKTGAFDYILKPFKLNTLLPVLSRAMGVRRLRMENMQLRETVAMHELGKAIAYAYDLNSILSKVADAALQQCDADEASIMLPCRNGKELQVAAIRGRSTEYLGENIPIDQGIAGWVAQNREPVILHGEVDDRRFSPIKPRVDISSAVSLPMLVGGNLVGVLNVNITRSRRPFTLGQVKALGILINIVSPILENTSLYIKVRQAEEQYRGIFENAVEGIYQSTPDGHYITANPALARMLGYASTQELMAEVTDIGKQNYVNPEDRVTIHKLLEKEGTVKGFESRHRRKDGSRFWVSINSRVERDRDGNIQYYEGIMEDITRRKEAEGRQKLTNEILEALNRPNDIINLIRDILVKVRAHTGIEAVGIRLREGEDFPYYVADGFPESFLAAERYLCARDDQHNIIRDSRGNPQLECMCGNILSGRINPALPFFTEGGSFWSNGTTELIASTSEEDRQACTRNRCNGEGYESVALIPLCSRGEIIGLLQLNDKRKGCFTLDMIQYLEGIGASIGIAVARQLAVKAIQESEENYRLHFENVSDIICSIDAQTKILNISPSVEKILGYKPEELIGKSVRKMGIIMPEGSETAFPGMDPIRAGEQAESFIHEFIAKDGMKKFFEIKGSSLIREGKSPQVICIARDITERKQAEEWLLHERYLTDRIMKTSPAAIIVLNRKGSVVFSNKRTEDLFGLTGMELAQLTYKSSPFRMMDHDGNPYPEERNPFTQVMADGEPVYGVPSAIEWPDGRRRYLLVNGAPIRDEQGHITDIILTLDDITPYKEAEERVQKGVKQLEKGMVNTIKAMSMVVETRDPYTAGHQDKVARLAVSIAGKMGLKKEIVSGIQMAGMIHDIGKMYIPADILSKPSRLSDIEMQLIRTHALAGYEIMKDIEFPWPVARIILEHHERMNGSGYPNRLKGDDILMEARIIAVADVVDAMASHRPYRPSLGVDRAIDEIKKNKGIFYDSAVVEACLALFTEGADSFDYHSNAQ